MKPENHTPEYRKTFEDGERWNCDCSCCRWHVRNRPRHEIREMHAQHIEEELGPEVRHATV